jgi:VCBS repeat-containing protein
VADAADLQEAVDALAPGDAITLTVAAPDGDTRTVEVTLGSRPEAAAGATAPACG